MRRSILIVLLLLVVLPCVLTAACGESPHPVTIVDDQGREVYIEKTPERIVSLAPSITEILFALDLGDKVVGVTEACDYPDEAKNKDKVGGYFTTSLDRILDQDPDVVFTDGHDPVSPQIEGLGIPLVVLMPEDIPGIFENIRLIGEVMNVEGKAAELADELQQRLDAVVEKTETLASRPTVFFEIDASDVTKPWTAGPGSFAEAMISLAGGQNVVKGGGEWIQISLEELLSADPEIIVLSDYPYVTPQDVLNRQGAWQSLRAIKLTRVAAISDPSLTSRPGPRIIDGLEEMARIIHPELFPS